MTYLFGWCVVLYECRATSEIRWHCLLEGICFQLLYLSEVELLITSLSSQNLSEERKQFTFNSFKICQQKICWLSFESKHEFIKNHPSSLTSVLQKQTASFQGAPLPVFNANLYVVYFYFNSNWSNPAPFIAIMLVVTLKSFADLED